jgi:acetyl esterase/lipase
MILRTACVAAGALVSGCSPLSVLNGLAEEDSVRRDTDVAYGPDPRQRLDVYAPSPGVTDAPVVVFFYGGSWTSGARGDYRFVGAALAARGMVTVIPDYRLYPSVRFPLFLDDCAASVRWCADHAARFGASSQRLFLAGHSAGAYNAAMLALDGSYLRSAGVDARSLRGFVGLAGPYDFLPFTSRVTRNVFGAYATPVATQPIHFVNPGAPSALLITGAADTVVDPGNSARLAVALRRQGATVREIRYPGVGHRMLVGSLAPPLRGVSPALEDVTGFVTG